MEGLELFDAKSGGDQIEGVGGLMGGAGAAGGLPSTPAPPPITEEESQMAAETIRLMMDRKVQVLNGYKSRRARGPEHSQCL